MNKPPMIITDQSVCVMLGDRSYTIDKTHINYRLVREAIKDKRWDDLQPLMDIKVALTLYSKGNYTITEEGVYYRGDKLHGSMESRMMAFLSEGLDFEYLLRFHERLQANPSSRAVNELYDFLEHGNIPIGEDGCFYAYKGIRTDWKDKYSNSIDNSIGKIIEMPRNQVDDDCNKACSRGVHVGALGYVKWYCTERVVIVKVDPADVVSVPRDHSCQKVRVCKYEVVSEYTGPLPETVWSHYPKEYGFEYEDNEEDECQYDCDICHDDGCEECIYTCMNCCDEGCGECL